MDSYRVLRYAIAPLAFSLIVSLYCVEGTTKGRPIEANVDAVKTIKNKYGDEYDCVDLYKQPAFDHSLLRNHRIQMRPSFDAQREVANIARGNGFSGTSIDVGLGDGRCPSGTVPIRRSRGESLRAEEMFRQHFPSFTASTGNTQSPFVFAGISTRKRETTVYHGAGGLISINNPSTNLGQCSASVISIEGGPNDQFSVIRVGWMVNADLYKDNRTRLYTIWGQGKDGLMHGCYNTYCPGFVQTDASFALDMILEPVSVIRGPQFYVTLAVSQDKSTGNWWLIYGEKGTPVGYWPSSLFSNLGKGADVLRWGGMVNTNTQQLPPMGNGDNGYIHSAHFRKIVLKYESDSSLNGTFDVPMGVIQTRCYKAGDNSYKNEYWGYSFYFGGNGGDVLQCS